MPIIPRQQPADGPGTPLPPPDITPEWVAELERWAAMRGLPPDPWPLPARRSR
jgi:hypothetical protein